MADPIDLVLAYHERTKHAYPNRFARSFGRMDWQNQPDPFRSFHGAPSALLQEIPPSNDDPSWFDLKQSFIAPKTLDLQSLSRFFYDSLALSAWKQAGTSKWPLRCNPSSGNLHPTEAYLFCPAIVGISAFPILAHYAPINHSLEIRRSLPPDASIRLALPESSFLVGLTSILWREAWKYGERAFRYCQHDVGHALCALSLSARSLGWSVSLVQDLSDDQLASLFGVHDQLGPEAEHPDLLIRIDTTGRDSISSISSESVALLSQGVCAGVPNTLSENHHDWPILDAVESASRYPGGLSISRVVLPAQSAPIPGPSFRSLARQRRSAVDMNPEVWMDHDVFISILESLCPSQAPGLHSCIPWEPLVHPLIFVHRVRDVAPGLYLLVRDQNAIDELKSSMKNQLDWIKPSWCPANLNLFELAQSDVCDLARNLSCGQDIAADGVFAVAMIAEFEGIIREKGAFWYRHLHWEAGHLGQLLYLSAEAAGIQATGIGCFFDDSVHQILGFEDHNWQSIYHFTLGAGTHDPRVTSLPAYG